MNTRKAVSVLALLALSCSTNGKSSAIIVTKVVQGKFTAATATAKSFCTFDANVGETSFLNVDPSGASGTVGVVISNQLTDPTGINSVLRTDTTIFTPHQVVADYQQIGGQTITNQIIPVSGASVRAGDTNAVITPFFAPAAVKTLAGNVRVTFHVEGKLDDGSTVHTTEHEYIFFVCPGAGCTDVCL